MQRDSATAGFRVAAILPDETVPDFRQSYPEAELIELAEEGRVDIAVFPEAFLAYEYDAGDPSAFPLEHVMGYAELIGIPVLTGAFLGDPVDGRGLRERFEVALFANPSIAGGNTRGHLYVKHSSAAKKAFEWPGYSGIDDSMYEPIVLGDKRIGSLVCHDMYYGPLCRNQVKRGANVLLDLTGGGVDEGKWRTVAATRSVDYDCPFLVTMNLRPGKGASIAFAYRNGRDLKPSSTVVGTRGRIEVFDLGDDGSEMYSPPVASVTDGKHFKKVLDFSVGSAGALWFDPDALVYSDGQPAVLGRWTTLSNGGESLAVLPLRAPELLDPMYVYRHMPPKGVKHHVLVVVPDPAGGVDPALLRLVAAGRAIEHLVAVFYADEDGWTCAKVTRYKQPQHVPQRIDGQVTHFRLDASGGLAGPWLAGGKHPHRGVGSSRDWQSIVYMGAAE